MEVRGHRHPSVVLLPYKETLYLVKGGGAERGPEPVWIVLEGKKYLSPTVMKVCMYVYRPT